MPVSARSRLGYLVFVTDQLLARAEPYLTAGTRSKLTEGKLGDLQKVK
jgi:hypothetical protein